MKVQLTLEGEPVKIKIREPLEPGTYFVIVNSHYTASAIRFTEEESKRVIRDVLGAE